MKESGRRIRRTIGTAFFLCAALSAPVYAGRWQKGSGKDKGKWWYNDLNGSYKKGGWFWIDGNDDGMAECYYFDKKGWLQVSKTIDGSSSATRSENFLQSTRERAMRISAEIFCFQKMRRR